MFFFRFPIFAKAKFSSQNHLNTQKHKVEHLHLATNFKLLLILNLFLKSFPPSEKMHVAVRCFDNLSSMIFAVAFHPMKYEKHFPDIMAGDSFYEVDSF